MTHCPYCMKEIKELGVVVKGTMTLSPTEGYSSVEEVEETLGYFCIDCGADLDFEKAKEVADQIESQYENN